MLHGALYHTWTKCVVCADLGGETSCMVLYSPTSLVSSLLLLGGNNFCSTKVPGNTAHFLYGVVLCGLG